MKILRILIATHKLYSFPNVDYYIPIILGKAQKDCPDLQADRNGENISEKNETFCELTALYWLWKNNNLQRTDIIGLVHYRRYFKGQEILLKNKRIISQKEILRLLENYDCIVPKKRNYYIETVYSHYKNAHHIEDLNTTREIIKEKYIDYLDSFDYVMNGRTLYLYNMFIIKKELFDKYCDWLFCVLFELESRIDISHYDNYQKRVFGFIAERLFNVWIRKNEIKCKEVKVVYLEKQNYIKKIFNLIKRKIKKDE